MMGAGLRGRLPVVSRGKDNATRADARPVVAVALGLDKQVKLAYSADSEMTSDRLPDR